MQHYLTGFKLSVVCVMTQQDKTIAVFLQARPTRFPCQQRKTMGKTSCGPKATKEGHEAS